MPSLEGRRACHVALRAVWLRLLIRIFGRRADRRRRRTSRRCLGSGEGGSLARAMRDAALRASSCFRRPPAGSSWRRRECRHRTDPARAALLVSSRRMAPRLFWGLRDFGSWAVGGESAVFALAPTLPHTQKIITGRYRPNGLLDFILDGPNGFYA